MYSQSFHRPQRLSSLPFRVLNIRTAISGSGKILSNSFRNKNRTSIHLFTRDRKKRHDYNSLLIPFTENSDALGCFSPKKTSYTRTPVYIGSTYFWLFHVKPLRFLATSKCLQRNAM